jgi:hypothetical protein
MTVQNYTNSGTRTATVKASAGTLYHVHVYNQDPRSQWIQTYDAASDPADGSTPIAVWPIAGQGFLDIDFGAGRPFVNGIMVCTSTTQFTRTGENNYGDFDIQYE